MITETGRRCVHNMLLHIRPVLANIPAGFDGRMVITIWFMGWPFKISWQIKKGPFSPKTTDLGFIDSSRITYLPPQ